ncbi:MAG TPA: HAMP domain-containing sensor histidine kinase [Nocardioides sp.]|jgi:signal transduction histidine kinase|nr:HAMP domain-containing sensor histidine kinase [Nocardioides sp.]
MRGRISWLVLATTSAVVVAFVIPLCLLVRTLAADRAMSAADQAARNVALVVSTTERTAELDAYLSELNRSSVPQVAVLTARGRSLGTTTDLRQDPDVRQALTGEGLRVTGEDGGAVLIPVDGPRGTSVVRAGVTEDDLRRGVAAAWVGIIGLGLVLLLLGWVIARQLGRRISEPLRDVAQTAHQLREGDLEARADVRGTPETVELARALNGLAERTTELLAAERAAAGDLSHRLRTPVTALRLDAESVPDPALAQRLQDHITALQMTVDQIVKEARRPVQSALSARTDASRTVADRVAFWSALAEDDGRPLRADITPGPLVVPVSESDLADLLDVLVDNVFAHTPEGTGFTVTLRATEGTCLLVVSDDGPGWSDAPSPRAGHTGLGLDIARRTAAQCGGHLVTGITGAGGARVEVALPLAH